MDQPPVAVRGQAREGVEQDVEPLLLDRAADREQPDGVGRVGPVAARPQQGQGPEPVERADRDS